MGWVGLYVWCRDSEGWQCKFDVLVVSLLRCLSARGVTAASRNPVAECVYTDFTTILLTEHCGEYFGFALLESIIAHSQHGGRVCAIYF